MKSLKNYKLKINIPDNIKIEKKNHNFIIKNNIFKNVINLHKLDSMGKVSFYVNEKYIYLFSNDKTFFKNVCTLIKNKIYGVNNGFLVSMYINGIGYKFEIDNIIKYDFLKKKKYNKQIIYFKIGFSHLYKYIVPLSVKIFLLNPTLICIYGIDKNIVYQTACKIKQIKKPNSYKLKGIYFLHEKIKLKNKKK